MKKVIDLSLIILLILFASFLSVNGSSNTGPTVGFVEGSVNPQGVEWKYGFLDYLDDHFAVDPENGNYTIKSFNSGNCTYGWDGKTWWKVYNFRGGDDWYGYCLVLKEDRVTSAFNFSMTAYAHCGLKDTLTVTLRLFDSAHDVVAQAEFNDAWSDRYGQWTWYVHGQSGETAPGTVDASEGRTFSIAITRNFTDYASVKIDGVERITALLLDDIYTVDVRIISHASNYISTTEGKIDKVELKSIKFQNGTNETSFAHHWSKTNTNSTYRFDFAHSFPNESFDRELKCTFPKGHQVINITYSIGSVWKSSLYSYNYTISEYNATHLVVSIPDATIEKYGGSYKLFTQSTNAVYDLWLEHNGQKLTYASPNKQVKVVVSIKDPLGNGVNQPVTCFLLNATDTNDVENRLDGTSVNGWFNRTLTLPSVKQRYIIQANTTGNYAGVLNYTKPKITDISLALFANDTRTNVGSFVMISGVAKYDVDNSNIPSGYVRINNTDLSISNGAFSMSVSQSSVGKWSYNIILASDSTAVDTATSLPSVDVIWDHLFITFSANNTNPKPKEAVTISWTITREWDNSTVTDFVINIARDGTLWNEDLTTSSTIDISDAETIHIYGVYTAIDKTHALTIMRATVFNSSPVAVSWKTPPAGLSARGLYIVIVIIVVIAIGIMLKKLI